MPLSNDHLHYHDSTKPNLIDSKTPCKLIRPPAMEKNALLTLPGML